MYLAAQTGLARLETSPEKQRKYSDFIDFYADLSDEEVMRYRARYLSGEGDIMGLASVLREEGRQEGVQQGMQKGMQEGMQKGALQLLMRLLEKKFGVISPDLLAKLEQADETQILLWSENILTADTLGAVFGH